MAAISPLLSKFGCPSGVSMERTRSILLLKAAELSNATISECLTRLLSELELLTPFHFVILFANLPK